MSIKSSSALNTANGHHWISVSNISECDNQRRHFDKFFETCLLSSKNWRSFILGKYSFESDDKIRPQSRAPEFGRNILTIGRMSGNAKLPNLKKLVIHFNAIKRQLA